jgi:hypothetical protein
VRRESKDFELVVRMDSGFEEPRRTLLRLVEQRSSHCMAVVVGLKVVVAGRRRSWMIVGQLLVWARRHPMKGLMRLGEHYWV